MKDIIKYNFKIDQKFLNDLIGKTIGFIYCWDLVMDYSMDGIIHSKSFSIRVGEFNNPQYFNISSDYNLTSGTGTTYYKFSTSVDDEIKFLDYNSIEFKALRAPNELIYHSYPIIEIEIYEMEYCENDNGHLSDIVISDCVVVLKTEKTNFAFYNKCGASGGLDLSTDNTRIEMMTDYCNLRTKIK